MPGPPCSAAASGTGGGHCSRRDELAETFELLRRNDFLDIPQIIIAAWGRCPDSS
ncbi:MAG TPA: hypothetical protein VGM75_25315 [Pseudonocardiaceae bacterium]